MAGDKKVNAEKLVQEDRMYLPGMECQCGGKVYVVPDGAKCDKCGQQNIKISGNAKCSITIA